MKNPTVVLSLLSAVFFIAASFMLMSSWRRIRLTANEFIPLFFSVMLYAFVVISNFLEHSGITSYFDPAEDLAEILFTLVFIIFASNWHQQNNIEALRKQETWLRVTLESMADGIMTINKQGHVQMLNKTMEHMIGRSREETTGKETTNILTFLDKETKQPITFNPFSDVFSSSSLNHSPRGLLLRGADGKATSISEKTTPIRSEDNEIFGAVTIFRDMTEYDSMTEQLTQVHKMEAIGQLAGGVAHDLNNMLAGVMGAADLMKGRMNLEEMGKYGNLISMILEASERASELTINLLVFSRKGKILSTPIIVRDVLKNTLAIAERTIDKKIILDCQYPQEQLKVVGEPAQLQNCFLNLLLNARDAMPEGGTIRITARTEYLDEQWCDQSPFNVEPGDYVCVVIEDNGSGIPEDIQQKIFEPFFTTKPEGKGTGLGLAGVYSAVCSHNGAITLQSHSGLGSTFCIYLPVTSVDAEKIAEHSFQCEGVEGGTVLIIDDESVIRRATQMILEQFGYTTFTASTGAEGIEIYKHHKEDISLVLLDMVMPILDGKDVLRELRCINSEVKVIATSGFSQNSMITSNVAAFLKKPYRQRELLQTVDRVISSTLS